MKGIWRVIILICITAGIRSAFPQSSRIRINQLGYTPNSIKVAVWGGKESPAFKSWQLVDAASKKVVFKAKIPKRSGPYGPFTATLRLNFSSFRQPGRYYLQAGNTVSPEFEIGKEVYKGAADFCLYYMRQQRSRFNPITGDSCHTQDGYTLYGPMPDSTFIDVSGGWHDATDYLQYVTTSANATYQMLAAYRDFPGIFGDKHRYNGLEGANTIPDILDEARWGLDWLLKMHPRADWMFNQVGDDRDHTGMRMPGLDSQYGRGYQRPVYFVSGEPQIRGRFMNNTKGTSSTAGKFSSAFSLGAQVFGVFDNPYAQTLEEKARTAFAYGLKKPGYTQTASVKSPYIYGEENWMDDMELAAAMLKDNNKLSYAFGLAQQEPVTPWIINDTAAHYQWYPFINAGHYELSKRMTGKEKQALISFYKQGIEIIWNRAKQNAFYRGIPFIWCSNNLTTAFTIQCYWYRQMSGDDTYEALEQANFDWLFGCNPWGSSMVYGLPAWGDTPDDPHASFLKVGNFPVNGGLVDGPVYGSIFGSLIGLRLTKPDAYAPFQSPLAVYHDDAGDYSTNEPTMDGTASLIYLLAAKEDAANKEQNIAPAKILHFTQEEQAGKKPFRYSMGGIIRGDSLHKKIAIVFTGDEWGDGGEKIAQTLEEQQVKASFFLTGNFYRNPRFSTLIPRLKEDGHYLGSHSDKHLLYCDWTKRDSLLVTRQEFSADLKDSYLAMRPFGINAEDAPYFLPPYEWYNSQVSAWANQMGVQLVNFTPGTSSNADYTTPEMKNYRSSDSIYHAIIRYEQMHGLNGFILLLHIGTDARRTDKMYDRLPELIAGLKKKGYHLVRIDELLQ